MHLKKGGVVYVRHSECDVDNNTECWVYFDVKYTDLNLYYNKDIDSWLHSSTPGLFQNIANLRFKDNINSWVPDQSHPHITIIWTNVK